MNSAASPPMLPPPAARKRAPKAAVIDPRHVARFMLLDSAAATSIWVGVVLVLVLGWAWSDLAPLLWLSITAIVFLLVFLTDYYTRAAWQQLPLITTQLVQDPADAEQRLGSLLGRAPMRRTIRVLLYHRLALLRYRQQRFAEVAGLCREVLTHPQGQAGQIRADLLLMLVDAQLQRGDLPGVYEALLDLARCPLPFTEQLQREALEIRYAVAAGHDASALQDLSGRVARMELLPAPQAASLHITLALAAGRTGRTDVSQWLLARGQLLGGQGQPPRVATALDRSSSPLAPQRPALP